jgi:hypothetical protein
MILYHFTPQHTLQGIMRTGLRLGVMPWNLTNGKVGFQPGWQWLTRNHEFGQEWCARMNAKLPFRRDDFRITINVPKIAEGRVISWREIARVHSPASVEYIASFPEHPDWYVFRGPIPQPWFLAVDKNPFQRQLLIGQQEDQA